MIKIVEGDLLKAKEDIIGHQVNCRGKMGSGIALQIKNKHPEVFISYKDFIQFFENEEDIQNNLMGICQVTGLENGKYVANLFGQNNYGYDGKQYTDTEALFRSLKVLRRTAERMNLSVALPYMIGCYRGGADWKIVEELILIAFEGYEVTLYKLHKG